MNTSPPSWASPPHPSPLGHQGALGWAPCVRQWCPTSCFTHGGVYMSEPLSQFLPPSLFPTCCVHKSTLYLSSVTLWATGLEGNHCRRLEKAMASHSSTLAWKIPWTEEPGRLQSMGSLRVWRDFTFMHWRRKWQPTPVFLAGESQGRGSLVGCCLWGCTELDMTEAI